MKGEAMNIWLPDGGNFEQMVQCFVSIGTGNPGTRPIHDSLYGLLFKDLKEIATDTEQTAKNFASHHRQMLDQRRYFRFNVDQGLQDVGLEEYDKQSIIETATWEYLEHQNQKFIMRDCARNLRTKECMIAESFS